MKTAWLSLGIVALTGCFEYVPIKETVPDRGTEVRANLASAQDLELGRYTVHEVQQIDGLVYRATPDSLVVQSQWLRSVMGERYGTDGDIYYFRRADMSDVEVRKIHPAKTVVALAGTIVAGFGVFSFVSGTGGGSDPGKGGDISALVTFPIN